MHIVILTEYIACVVCVCDFFVKFGNLRIKYLNSERRLVLRVCV